MSALDTFLTQPYDYEHFKDFIIESFGSKAQNIKTEQPHLYKAGNIIKRQRGTVHHPGENVGMGKDHTLFALIDGIVVFTEGKNGRQFINVKPAEA